MENKYVLLDVERNSYWKKNNFGYTKILEVARKFTLEEAKAKAEAPNTKDLIIIPFGEAEVFLEGYEIELMYW